MESVRDIIKTPKKKQSTSTKLPKPLKIHNKRKITENKEGVKIEVLNDGLRITMDVNTPQKISN